MKDLIREKKNSFYYTKLLEKEREDKPSKTKKPQVKIGSFGSQKVAIEDYIYIPENMKIVAYTFYIVFLPYIVGAIFLFFAIAGGSFDNFMLLDLKRAFIVWAIGYEIVAIGLLVWIFRLFLKYNE